MNFSSDVRLVCVDIETTGLNPEFDRIIELGVVEHKGQELILEHSKLFGGGRSSPYVVKSVHGIKDCMREKMPSFEESAKDIATYLSGSVLVGHNLKKFDYPFITHRLAVGGYKLSDVRLVDTLVLARRMDYASNTLEDLSARFGIEHGKHRATGDAWTCHELLVHLMKVLNVTSLEEICC